MKYTTTTFEHLLIREDPDSLITSPPETNEIVLTESGILGGGKHYGHFVPAGVRNEGFHRRSQFSDWDMVFNHRQISIIDSKSLEEIGDGLDIDPDVVAREFDESRSLFIARRIGANVVVGALSSGEDFHDIAPPYHIGPFDEAELFTAAMLIISYNQPCVNPGRAIAAAYPGAGESMGLKFMEVAKAGRGFVGVVSLATRLHVGQEAMIVPLPKVPHEAAA
jgi:hypothetical protein